MPTLEYFATGFKTLNPPGQGTLDVSEDDLVRAAIRVGYSPAVTTGYRRSLLELLWRALMVLANLEEHPKHGTWRKSEAYRRLDASEKSAVSYFLGMTQATLTAEQVLGFPELAHLDAVLALLGKKSKQSRPDLVAYDPTTATTMLAMEAKGRTWSRGQAADKAKKQAKSLPPGVGNSSTIAVASVASFEKRGAWEALLVDPPGNPYEDLRGVLTPGLVQLAYYLPLVQALRDPGAEIDSGRSDSDTTVAYVPAGDLWLGVPAPVVSLLSDAGDLYSASESSRTAWGADLVGTVAQLPDAGVAEHSGPAAAGRAHDGRSPSVQATRPARPAGGRRRGRGAERNDRRCRRAAAGAAADLAPRGGWVRRCHGRAGRQLASPKLT